MLSTWHSAISFGLGLQQTSVQEEGIPSKAKASGWGLVPPASGSGPVIWQSVSRLGNVRSWEREGYFVLFAGLEMKTLHKAGISIILGQVFKPPPGPPIQSTELNPGKSEKRKLGEFSLQSSLHRWVN